MSIYSRDMHLSRKHRISIDDLPGTNICQGGGPNRLSAAQVRWAKEIYVWWWNNEPLAAMPRHPSMEKWKAKDAWQKTTAREIEGRKR